jgi:hypothetical protein
VYSFPNDSSNSSFLEQIEIALILVPLYEPVAITTLFSGIIFNFVEIPPLLYLKLYNFIQYHNHIISQICMFVK